MTLVFTTIHLSLLNTRVRRIASQNGQLSNRFWGLPLSIEQMIVSSKPSHGMNVTVRTAATPTCSVKMHVCGRFNTLSYEVP